MSLGQPAWSHSTVASAALSRWRTAKDLVCIALFCAWTAFDMSAYSGNATPLHACGPHQPRRHGLVLRLVSVSIEAFAGLLGQWKPMDDTVTERVVRSFVHLKGILSPPDAPSTMLRVGGDNATTLLPSLVAFLSKIATPTPSQSSAADTPPQSFHPLQAAAHTRTSCPS
ncbi:hypothetical protein H257_18922 [Aphanomyces astaci]|uniref:Uncharacterized protein n=1 Tax=Aphanomyces astaci TaxID=112090 RepID=W4FBS6_APHAT|nr:hypothetical protein H257_18922 [Aphanomyces astaci]ETV64148.1 hypothetical protein H257_18922 [Aphanomyces astaci]|eukprot:XP_009846372.1 hypothetical protein H257_18922 [Aphanomyces astaci]